MIRGFRYVAVVMLLLLGGGCVVSKPIVRTPVEEPSAYRETVFGYMTSITASSNGPDTVTVQPALWLTGLEAQMMAMEDGACDTPEDCNPNDYYIHRFDQTVSYPVSASVLVQTYTDSSGLFLNSDDNGVFLAPVSYEAFKQAYAAKDVFKQVPYHIELQNGEIVTMTEQYVP